MKITDGILGFLVAAGLFLFNSCNSEVVNQNPMVVLKNISATGEIKIADLNNALKLDPNNAGLYAKRAKLYLQEKQLGKALTNIEKAIKLNSNQAEYYFWKAVILRDSGRITEALETVEEAEKLGLKDPNGYFLQAELLSRKNNYPAALEKVTLGLNEEPDNEYGLFYKGLARAATNDTASAIVLYRRAIRNAPEFIPPYLQLGSIFNSRKSYEEANYYLKSSKALEPDNAFLWYQRGLRYNGVKQPDSAYISFLQAAKLDSDLYLANYQLALLDYKRGNFAGAAENLEKVKTGPVELPLLQEMLAESYERTGRFQEAIAVYNQILRRKPNDVKSTWGVRRSTWGVRKMQRDSLRRDRENKFYKEDTINF